MRTLNLTLSLVAIAALAAVFAYPLIVRGSEGSRSARQLVADGAQLVDVRTREEYAAGHIAGAKNIPVQELEQRLGELGPKDAPVVLYCRSGRRSASAKRLLEAAGWTKVHDAGAMSSW